jgi:hypothetical protein
MTRSASTLEALADIRAACQKARALAPTDYPPDLPAKPELLGAPDWYPFEHTVWALGEDVRQALTRAPSLRRDVALLGSIAEVLDTVNLRRGRQSFAMALGFKGAAPLAPRLAEHLSDGDLRGHIVQALLKIGAPGFASAVAPLLNDKQTWIRRLARTYLARYGAAA